ncbi:hypothetical protein ACQVRV_07930 [Ralstonia pseudosolanacearum]
MRIHIEDQDTPCLAVNHVGDTQGAAVACAVQQDLVVRSSQRQIFIIAPIAKSPLAAGFLFRQHIFYFAN